MANKLYQVGGHLDHLRGHPDVIPVVALWLTRSQVHTLSYFAMSCLVLRNKYSPPYNVGTQTKCYIAQKQHCKGGRGAYEVLVFYCKKGVGVPNILTKIVGNHKGSCDTLVSTFLFTLNELHVQGRMLIVRRFQSKTTYFLDTKRPSFILKFCCNI